MAQRTYYNSKSNGPFGSIISLLVVVMFFVALFFVASFVFKIMWYYIAPVLLLITLVMDHKIITGYIEWIWNKLKTNPVTGIAFVLLTIFGYPIVAGYLFGKLMLRRKITQMKETMQQRGQGPFTDAKEGDYVDYEEVDSEPTTRIEIPKADLPPKVKQKPQNNKYDDLFE